MNIHYFTEFEFEFIFCKNILKFGTYIKLFCHQCITLVGNYECLLFYSLNLFCAKNNSNSLNQPINELRGTQNLKSDLSTKIL